MVRGQNSYHPFTPTHSCVYAEIIDFGYPQNSEIDTLKSYITTESVVSTATDAVWPFTQPLPSGLTLN
jgi:hypothetical protein